MDENHLEKQKDRKNKIIIALIGGMFLILVALLNHFLGKKDAPPPPIPSTSINVTNDTQDTQVVIHNYPVPVEEKEGKELVEKEEKRASPSKKESEKEPVPNTEKKEIYTIIYDNELAGGTLYLMGKNKRLLGRLSGDFSTDVEIPVNGNIVELQVEKGNDRWARTANLSANPKSIAFSINHLVIQ